MNATIVIMSIDYGSRNLKFVVYQ